LESVAQLARKHLMTIQPTENQKT